MARQISIVQIPKVMEEAVETLVAATTLEWTARVKKATPVRVVYKANQKEEGNLETHGKQILKNLVAQYQITYLMQNLFVLEKTCHHLGIILLEQNSKQLKHFQSL